MSTTSPISINRTEGLIWIDRNSPYRLKYHTRGEDYTVEVATNYDVTSDSSAKKISAGQVLTLKSEGTGENAKVIATHAKFPKDLDAIAGVALQSQLNGKVIIGNSGYIVLNAAQIGESFVSGDVKEIIDAGVNEEGAPAYVGAPVYWFIGRFKKGENGGSDGFDYSSSTANIGCITVGTPSGYKWGRTKFGSPSGDDTNPKHYISDRAFNVEYENLPQIGNIIKYEIEGESIKSMTIQLNFSDFDSTIEWSWPYICEGSTGCGKVSQIDSDKNTNFSNRRQIDIKHCLFPNGTDGVKFGATESVTAYYEHDDTFDEYHIETAMKHITDNKGGYSQFNGNTPEDDLKYRITGSVTYKAHTNA